MMNNTFMVQSLIKFIEENLDQKLDQDVLSAKSGYSKYHLHRIFKSEVGHSPSEYVRNRRIATASVLLMHTEISIIDIALSYQFGSQEAFSRSFKKVYNLSPGKYRKWMSKIITKKEENIMENNSSIAGWLLSGSHPHHYKMGIDKKIFHRGQSSGYLQSINPNAEDQFATMMQTFKADKFKGTRVKLSSFIKTEDVESGSGMWMRVDDTLGDVLQFDNMSNRLITSTTDWNHYAIILDIPESSTAISFGVLLTGKGKVWADAFQFSIVDDSTPTTNIDMAHSILDEPTNLSFEGEE